MGRVKDYHQSTIPDIIRLADGREYSTEQLLKQANQNRVNLKRDGTTVKKCSPARAKYTNKETEWIVKSSIKDIMLKYGCTIHKAHYIKNSVMAREGLSPK